MTMDRERVLRDAAELLSRNANATQDEIARAAGISRATLHRHFAGRDALVRALEELAIRQLEEALDRARTDEGPAREALRRLVAESEPIAAFMAFLFTENQLFENGATNAGWERVDARIHALFQRGQEAGEFRIDLTPAWLTEAFHSLVAGGAWAVQAGKTAARDYPYMVSELLLGGVTRQDRPQDRPREPSKETRT
ncbi:MAG TPA: helix-turn-helix domain-containing protein [Yinghuangia sp.]|uniref:TetR/AcrR family transcriptional regulator n=1 Tax=Yinghuangia sp. YIM S10712 TaxID=3436930 RepID=UPI002BD807F1|nr:helix-turn-helix domain-containing protein [Yinghuangia sp.]